MADLEEPEVYIELWQQGKEFQVSIGEKGGGFRIFGPKFDGTGRLIRRHKLERRDVSEIQGYIDRLKEGEL